MFLLDTNVVSELLRPTPDLAVETWVGARRGADLYFSAISEAELRYGVAILSPGRRRNALASAVEAILREDFHDRILPFDSKASAAWADIAATQRAAGRVVGPMDCQIAAIARSRGMAVATRNVQHFEGIDIDVINPWSPV